jgi:hypothetical protein
VSVDELVTLAQIWDLEIPDMLQPMELIEQRRAQELIETFQRNERNMGRLFTDIFSLCVDLIDLVAVKPELYDYVINHVMANPLGLTRDISTAEAEGVPDDYVRATEIRAARAMSELRSEMIKMAGMWRAGSRGELKPYDEARIRALLEETDGQHQEA